MQVDLTTSEIMQLRSLTRGRIRSLDRRKPDPNKMGALSTLAIEKAHVQGIDAKLEAAMNDDSKATR